MNLSIANLLLGAWLILLGGQWLNWWTLSTKALGIITFIVGVVFVVHAIRRLELDR
jgi:hypothetical protein